MKNKKAFTLVELLIVVAIIGVLAGILFPAISKVMSIGPQLKSSNAAKNITTSWLSYGKLISKPTVHEWAAVLAERCDLNEPKMWILESDPKVQEKMAEEAVDMPSVVADNYNDNWSLNEDFSKFPISWSVANKTLHSSKAKTPLLWSRGLGRDGSWDEIEGVFGSAGGHMAFVDGHVEWFESLRSENEGKGLLEQSGKSTMPTSNIYDAVRDGSSNILNP